MDRVSCIQVIDLFARSLGLPRLRNDAADGIAHRAHAARRRNDGGGLGSTDGRKVYQKGRWQRPEGKFCPLPSSLCPVCEEYATFLAWRYSEKSPSNWPIVRARSAAYRNCWGPSASTCSACR